MTLVRITTFVGQSKSTTIEAFSTIEEALRMVEKVHILLFCTPFIVHVEHGKFCSLPGE